MYLDCRYTINKYILLPFIYIYLDCRYPFVFPSYRIHLNSRCLAHSIGYIRVAYPPTLCAYMRNRYNLNSSVMLNFSILLHWFTFSMVG
jgi:hypothetical protein